MDYMNQPQGAPVAGGQQGTDPAQPNAQSAQMNGGYQSAQPQPGGFYQFQPGVGFVQVQGPAMQADMGAAPNMGTQPGMDQSTMGQQTSTDATAGAQAGMFGQGTPEGAEPKFDQNKLGNMYSTVNDVINGEADPSSLIGLFADNSGDFWKGALVGAAAVMLLNNDTVKGALAGVAGSVGSMFGETDPEGKQVTVDDK